MPHTICFLIFVASQLALSPTLSLSTSLASSQTMPISTEDTTKTISTSRNDSLAIPTRTTDSDSSFFLVSVIKSIAGVAPELEFFDVTIKFNYGSDYFSQASADFALSNRSTDSVTSSQRSIAEAGLSFNRVCWKPESTRTLFIGAHAKIFNTLPYVGILLGSMETDGELLSSYLTVSYLYRIARVVPEKSFIENNSFRSNVFFEFALHSEKLEFLKYLRIKGGILLPLGEDPNNTINSIVSRITIEVPLGGIRKFK